MQPNSLTIKLHREEPVKRLALSSKHSAATGEVRSTCDCQSSNLNRLLVRFKAEARF